MSSSIQDLQSPVGVDLDFVNFNARYGTNQEFYNAHYNDVSVITQSEPLPCVINQKNHLSFQVSPRPLYFNKCKSRLCLTCPFSDPSNISSVNTQNIPFCKTFNCIYQLKCTICDLAYIGQTSNPLHLRINLHRSNVNKYRVQDNIHTNFEFDHFKKHGFENILISILDIVPQKQNRIMVENAYMVKNQTLFPYGLNQLHDHSITIRDKFSIPVSYQSTYSILYKVNNQHRKRTKRGKNNKRIKYPTPNYHLTITKTCEHFQTHYNINQVRTFVFAIPKKQLSTAFQAFLGLSLNIHFSHLFYDLITFRAKHLQFPLSNFRQVNNNTNVYCKIHFCHPILDKINFAGLLNDHQDFPLHNLRICKTLKYNTPIGRKIYNYNDVSKNFHQLQATCICQSPHLSKFVDQHHKHIITGSLDIIHDNTLKGIMQFGSKFKMPSCNSKKAILNSIIVDINSFVYKLSRQNNLPIDFFRVWKINLLAKIKSSLSHIQFSKEIVAYRHVKPVVLDLQKHFVFSYADKAESNYAITCKFFYIEQVKQSLLQSSGLTVVPDSLLVNNKHILALHKLLKIKHENLEYPHMVLIPKFHKQPISFRTVTCGHNTYLNKMDALLLTILKKIFVQALIDNTNHIIINNSYEVINRIHNYGNIYALKTFDFKDLFNNIQLHDLYEIILRFYRNIVFHHWPHEYNITQFSNLLKCVLFYNYLLQGGVIYQKTVGIPQGNKTSSILANLYLLHYEKNLVHHNYLVFRFIDDVITIKLTPQESEISLDVYPNSLQLVPNDSPINNVHFLDLNVSFKEDHIPIFDIYDKRSEYNFSVTRFPHFTSCLHKSVFKNLILSSYYRIIKLSDHSFHQQNFGILMKYLLKQKYPPSFINKYLKC